MAFEWLPGVSWHVLALVFVTVLAAYAVFGATGFGSSVIAVPLLAHAFPLTFAVPFLTSLDAFATTNASYRQWRSASFAELRRIVPALLLGIVAGTTLLVRLPRAPALLALGIFIALYGLYIVFARPAERVIHGAWAWPIGFVGGLFSVLFGTGGPIYIVYLSSRIHDKTMLRATSSLLIAMSVLLRIGVFIVSGLLLQPGLLVLALMMLPVMLAGYGVGSRLHHALSRHAVMRLIAAVLLANGLSLITRSLAMLRDT